MSRTRTRGDIVEEADGLFYRKGYEQTAFSDIAEAVGISRGNFYFHFKTKDEILAAVIRLRVERTQGMLERWEAEGERPKERIRCYIRILTTNWAKIKLYGCPVGTLCGELAKLNHPSQAEAKELLTIFREWLRREFEAAGRRGDADELAMQVLGWSQGVATLASAFRDERFVRKEVRRMERWLDAQLGSDFCSRRGGKRAARRTK